MYTVKFELCNPKFKKKSSKKINFSLMHKPTVSDLVKMRIDFAVALISPIAFENHKRIEKLSY
jgi:hypothetical protein